MRPHTPQRSAWAGRLGLLAFAALLPFGAVPGQDAPPPAPAEGAQPPPKMMKTPDPSAQKPAAPAVPLVAEAGFVFGPQSVSLRELVGGEIVSLAFSADGK